MRNDRHIADAGKKGKNEITSLKEDAVNLILKDIRELGARVSCVRVAPSMCSTASISR